MPLNRGSTTFPKLGVQFLGLGYYYPSTEKIRQLYPVWCIRLHNRTQYIKKLCKSRGSVQILERSEPPVVAPMPLNTDRGSKERCTNDLVHIGVKKSSCDGSSFCLDPQCCAHGSYWHITQTASLAWERSSSSCWDRWIRPRHGAKNSIRPDVKMMAPAAMNAGSYDPVTSDSQPTAQPVNLSFHMQ